MQHIILETLWLLIPAMAANMTPVLVKWIPLLNLPIDNGYTYRGIRLLGQNKTWRGLVFGTLAAMLAAYIQLSYGDSVGFESIFTTNTEALIVGFLLGFGALVGDAVASFFKRQCQIAPGKPWPPFDQLDWVAGALIMLSFVTIVSLETWIAASILFLFLHPAANYLGYMLKIKKNKW